MTPQRRCVVEAIGELPGHPTVDQVHRSAVLRMPELSLRSVYQVIHDLEDLGEIDALDVGLGATRIDRNLEHHHHLVCSSCGRVEDVAADLADVTVPDGSVHGFTVDRADVVYRGLCPACAASTVDEANTR